MTVDYQTHDREGSIEILGEGKPTDSPAELLHSLTATLDAIRNYQMGRSSSSEYAWQQVETECLKAITTVCESIVILESTRRTFSI